MSEISLTIVDRNGREREITAGAGDVLMHVLRDNISVEIGICGGEISCGSCLVGLDPRWAAPGAGADEAELLEVLGAGGHARLGCQVVLDDSAHRMTVTLLHED